jgi:hypothetical protein
VQRRRLRNRGNGTRATFTWTGTNFNRPTATPKRAGFHEIADVPACSQVNQYDGTAIEAALRPEVTLNASGDIDGHTDGTVLIDWGRNDDAHARGIRAVGNTPMGSHRGDPLLVLGTSNGACPQRRRRPTSMRP